MKPHMNKISVVAILALLLLCSVSTPVTTGTKDVSVHNSVFPDLPAITDTVCLKCYADSIEYIQMSVKKNIAKMDSLSAKVSRNTQKIAENNSAINAILHACATPDTVYVVKEAKEAKDVKEVKDTIVHTMEVRKKIK